MPYEIGAKVKLARDVPVTGDGTATRIGLPGPLFLAEGLTGIVTGAANETGGVPQDAPANFDRQLHGVRLDGFAAGLVDGLRQRFVGQGEFDTGVGARIRYRVRFDNGFVLDGLEDDWLTRA